MLIHSQPSRYQSISIYFTINSATLELRFKKQQVWKNVGEETHVGNAEENKEEVKYIE